MFCSKCGKEIESGTICNECLASEITEAEVVATAEVCESAPVLESEYPEPDNAKYGF